MGKIVLVMALALAVGIPGAYGDEIEEAKELNRRGAELLGEERIEEALTEFQKAAEVNPKDPVARLNVAYVLDRQGKVEEAIAAYKRAIELDPKNLLAYNNLGVLLNKLERYDEAIWEMENALSISPSDANTLKNLETAKKNKAIMQGRENELAQLRQAVDIQPDNPLALFKLGRMYAFYDRQDEAFEWLTKAMERGYTDYHNLQMDPALEKIRDDSRFSQLMANSP